MATSNKSLEHIPNFKRWVAPTGLPIGLFTVVKLYSWTEVFCWIKARETSTSASNSTVESWLEFNYVLGVFKHCAASWSFRVTLCQRAKRVPRAPSSGEDLHAVRCVRNSGILLQHFELDLDPVADAEQARCWHKMSKWWRKHSLLSFLVSTFVPTLHNCSHANPYGVAL